MSKLIPILILLCNFELHATDVDKLTNHIFFQNLSHQFGIYDVNKGSSDMCTGGELKAVGDDISQGFRLGQSIFFGPFNDDTSEKLSNGCTITTEYKVSKNSIEQKRVATNCKDMATTTKSMTFGEKEITYQVLESNFKCTFSKQAKKRGAQ